MAGDSLPGMSPHLDGSHNLPIEHEDNHNAPDPGRHLCLNENQEQVSAVAAVVEARRTPIQTLRLAALSAGAFHVLILVAGAKKMY
jgi:hypothetical protein